MAKFIMVLLWAVVGLSAIILAHGAVHGATTHKAVHGATTHKPVHGAKIHKAVQTTASLTVSNSSTTQALPVSTTTLDISLDPPRHSGLSVATSPKMLRVQRSTKQHGQTVSLPSNLRETQLATASASAPTTTTKPSRKHRRRHGKRKTRMNRHHAATKTLSKTTADYNLTSSASDAAATKTAATAAKSSNAQEERYQKAPKGQSVAKEQTANQGNSEDVDPYYDTPEVETEKPQYYTYSLKSSFNAKLGEPGPEFASSENYARRPVEDYEEAESNDNVKTDDARQVGKADTPRTEPKKQCKMMLKPMPEYIHYAGQVEKSSNYGSGPMMTCYVCGTKDDPYGSGGFSEECSYSPSKQYNVLANFVNDRPSRQATVQSRSPDHPYLGSSTNDKLYAGKGHTPYLTGGQGSNKEYVKPTYDQYYNDGYRGGEHEPQATSHSGGGGQGGDYGGGSGDGGGNGDGGSNGAATEKETCKISYRGKMKCKVCGDPKSDAVFSEQCDYEKDDPNQQKTSSYDYGTRGEKSYKSPDNGKGGGGGGGNSGYGGDGGYGGSGGHGDGGSGGHGDGGSGGHGDGGSGGHGGGGSGGHGDGGYGGDGGGYGGDDEGYGGYPDYGGYGSGSGTGYGSNYGADPYSGGDYGGGSDGGYGNDKHDGGSQDDSKDKSGGSHGSDDGKYSGSRQSEDYTPEQPQASNTHVSGKKGSGNDKQICKVVYKDFTSYYDSKSKDKSKPKMKCTVCTRSDGYGGVTEECTYNGGGESAAHGNFPNTKDLSSFYGAPQLERFYSPSYNEDRDSYY